MTKIDRPSAGTGSTAADVAGSREADTVRCTPLAGRMVGDGATATATGSSRPEISSDHTPAALTTTDARTSNSAPPSATTVAPVTRPDRRARSNPVKVAWLAATAP